MPRIKINFTKAELLEIVSSPRFGADVIFAEGYDLPAAYPSFEFTVGQSFEFFDNYRTLAQPEKVTVVRTRRNLDIVPNNIGHMPGMPLAA